MMVTSAYNHAKTQPGLGSIRTPNVKASARSMNRLSFSRVCGQLDMVGTTNAVHDAKGGGDGT